MGDDSLGVFQKLYPMLAPLGFLRFFFFSELSLPMDGNTLDAAGIFLADLGMPMPPLSLAGSTYKLLVFSTLAL